MALATYSDLQGAMSTWMMGAPSTQSSDIIALAEAVFNTGYNDGMIDVPALRTRQQVTTTTLSPTSGEFTLPDDYAAWRNVVEDASQRRPLENLALSEAEEIFPDRPAGLGTYFTISGSTLRVYPTISNDIELTYWAKIPDLETNNTNWLLTNYPHIYLAACQMFMADILKDQIEYAKHSRRVAGFINGLNDQDDMAEYAATGLHVEGCTP